MLGLVKAYAALHRAVRRGVIDMPSDLSTAMPQAHRGRDLAIGGSVLCAALIAGVLTCLPILTSSLATAKTPALPVTATRTSAQKQSTAACPSAARGPWRRRHRDPDLADQAGSIAATASADGMRKLLRAYGPGRQCSGALRDKRGVADPSRGGREPSRRNVIPVKDRTGRVR